ncbi:HD domain-containing phosphohydrolase [Candidatus Omnitrophota bacterium]
MGRYKLRSFRVKVTLAFIMLVVFSAVISNFFISKFYMETQFTQLRNQLMTIAQTAALTVDAHILLGIPLNREGISTAQFQIVADKLRKIKEANPDIEYIYTMTKTDQEGIWQYVVDPDPLSEEEEEAGLSSFPGDKYDASRFPQMLKGFEEASADHEFEVDEWGATLSGYAPIYDANGKVVAMLGIDMMADNILKVQKLFYKRLAVLLGLGVSISIFLGTLLSMRITGPINKLVEGTRHIAEGDLDYHVMVKGKDEINELGESFNHMAESLSRSRKRLSNYFYNVMHSFIRILEAKDKYTRGHSERVSEYAGKVAVKMGLSPEKTELLREAGLLHDIGKLGIQESILNKRDKLTDEEWEVIKQHPLIAEDILKPIILTPEMLETIKEHHERYDGKGYPKHLSGDHINLFAHILAVVDSYDAMTSLRAYRQELSKETAIEELKKNKGTQFNPGVVDIFVQVLQEES